MTTRGEKLQESYAKQTKAVRKLAEIEQQIFDLEGSYLEGASLKVLQRHSLATPSRTNSCAHTLPCRRAGITDTCARSRSATRSLRGRSGGSPWRCAFQECIAPGSPV